MGLVVVAAVAVAVAVAATGGRWPLSPGPSVASPSLAFGALYPVNPNGTSVDDDRCLTPAQDYGQSQPDWGEDYLSGGRLYLNFTGAPEAHVAAVRELLPSDCSVYVRIVPVSSAVGRALQDRIGIDRGSLEAAGVEVNSIGFDPITDKVRVGVTKLTPQVQAELERRYSKELIDVVQEAPAVPAAS